MRRLFQIILIVSLLSGCKKHNSYVLSETFHLKNYELFNSPACFTIGNINAKSGFVITDMITYNKYADSLRFHGTDIGIDCDTATLMDIDFNIYSLIGIATGYGACDSIQREFVVDEVNQELFYTIDIQKSTENCIYKGILDLNLALITKIPDNYTVKFIVNEH